MIEAHITIPSIHAGGFVQFLIDTGADCTTLTPADARRLRVDYPKLTTEDHGIGYTGATMDYVCPAIITFSEIGVVEYEYDIDLRITKPDPDIPELFILPSLLGRDIINRWQINFDPQSKLILATIINCDREIR